MNNDWYQPLNAIESRGSTSERPGSLAGLAAARRNHLGQFFTPAPIAGLMWQIVEPTLSAAFESTSDCEKITILDNSVGSGRLLQFASPEHYALYGVDVDDEVVNALGKVAEVAGFTCQFECCGMENIKPKRFNLALINPPFSVPIESPFLEPYPCTSYGKFGPNTSTVSHAYALAQAVEAAQLVIALLPTTFARAVLQSPGDFLPEAEASRLAAHIQLPSGSFREEGTDVRVSLLVFDARFRSFRMSVTDCELASLNEVTELDLKLSIAPYTRNAKLRVHSIDDDGPSITRPVTKDRRVRMVHDGRKIRLKFACGLTQAKVENAVLRCHIEVERSIEGRRPRGIHYAGQGLLDLEVHLAQPDPIASLSSLEATIAKAGGIPIVDPGLMNFLRKRIREHKRQAEALRHTVFIEEGVAGNDSCITGVAKHPFIADCRVWGSPVVKAGQSINFQRDGGDYKFTFGDVQFNISPEILYENFVIERGAAESGWHTVHGGLLETFPTLSAARRKLAIALGIDKWLTWQFQLDDLIELSMKPIGAIAAWNMGLGKARLALALVLLSGSKRGLITTEAGLIDEMIIELKGLPIPRDSWQVIEKPGDLVQLKSINLISYERLRMPINGKRDLTTRKYADKKRMRDSYASKLRRRIGVAVSDEGDLLSNPESDQSKAIWHVSAKRRYVLTGTPIANYPRDALPILTYAAGDGTAAQPWGWRRGHLEAAWIASMSNAVRGVDAFRNRFVTLDWVTKEFEDTMISGAKREIPRIQHLDDYRQMLAPHIKRRIDEEPDVSACVTIPAGERSIVTVPWDNSHLAYYLKVCEQFASWFSGTNSDQGRKNNLIAILARLRAVTFAADFPQHGVEGFGKYPALTSKQRWVLDELESLSRAGRKTIVYVENPGHVQLLGQHLTERGVDFVPFHGEISIKRRMKDLDARFRFGDTPNLLATLAVTQKGLNLPQANEVIMLSRSWSATVEEQAIKRPLRPQQKQQVRIRYIHSPGGIEVYKAQLVNFKRDSARAGLDWGTPETGDIEFLHLDTILNRFARDMATVHQLAASDLRKFLESLDAKETSHA